MNRRVFFLAYFYLPARHCNVNSLLTKLKKNAKRSTKAV